MQTTSAPMACLFLQENVQVQYLQKIALRAENKRVQSLVSVSTLIIFCVSNFLSPLRRQFSGPEDLCFEAIKGRGPIHGDGLSRILTILLKPNVSNPFSPSLLKYKRFFLPLSKFFF